MGTQAKFLQDELSNHTLVVKYKELNKAFNELKKQQQTNEQVAATARQELETKLSLLVAANSGL